MGYGFKIGGRGIVLRPTEIKVYDGTTDINNLTIEGSSPTKTLRFTYIADNGKLGDGNVILTSDSEFLSVSQTDSQKKVNEFTLTFNGMDVDEASVNLTLSVEETKHFLATVTTLPIVLKRSEPTITLATTELKIVGGSPSGSINISSYDGDGELTAVSSDTNYATVEVANSSGVTVNYVNGDKNLTVTVGCKAGKFYKASEGAVCAVTCSKSTPTLTLNGYSATIYGGGSSAVVNVTHKGLNGSTANLGTVRVSSASTSIATASLTNGVVTIAYVAAGSTEITISTDATNYYSSASAVVSVTCARTSVTIPTLKATSVACTGSTVGPGVNNYNSSLMNQSGTVSTATLGTYTVTWSLKDTTRYCWSDGTTANKSATWSCVGGTITIYTSVIGTIPSITWQGTYAAWASFKPSNINNVGIGSYKYGWTYTSSGKARIRISYLSTGSDETRKWYYKEAYVNMTGSAPTIGTTYSLNGYSAGYED